MQRLKHLSWQGIQAAGTRLGHAIFLDQVEGDSLKSGWKMTVMIFFCHIFIVRYYNII